MDLELKDNHVVITGGSSGIGFACAAEYLKEGARVSIISRSTTKLNECYTLLTKLIPNSNNQLFIHSCDLGDAEAAEQVIKDIEAEHGPIDILVNSAGTAKQHQTLDILADDWHVGMDSKYFLSMHTITSVIRLMRNRKKGSIVNIAGMGGKIANQNSIPRGAASSAIMLASAGLANEYAAYGIRVNVVNPTYVLSIPVEQQEYLTLENSINLYNELYRGQMPIGRVALPKEVADAVLFLSSPRASYISGVALSIDGAANPVII